MFLNYIKFCYNRNLFNQRIDRHINYISNNSMRNIFKLLQNSERDVAKTQYNNQEEPKLILDKKYITDRTFSTHHSPVIRVPRHMASKKEVAEFMSIFPVIVSEFVENTKRLGISELGKRLETLLQYNVPTGKQFRGLGLVVAYKMMESPENLTSENIGLANILGWCVEIIFSFMLIVDDIMDNSEIRRGCSCWYKVKGVGLQAVNDGILIENGAYMILQKYFSNHPNYVEILDMFHDSVLKTHMGESIDLMSMSEGKPNFELFTMETFKAIVKLKASYFTTYLPITLAMHLSRKYDEDLHQQAKGILMEMGEFYQIQNDFVDYFGNPGNGGKNGNDICEGKCTWLAVVTLQRGSPEQIKIFKEHYGKGNNAESEQTVRNLYEELGLPHIYEIYEKESFNLIRTRIQQTSKELPHELLFKFVENMYGR